MTERVQRQIEQYCSRLVELDAGDRARLKRCAGRSLAESREAMGIFYAVLPYGVPTYQEESYFLLGTLFPLADPAESGNLGRSLCLARGDGNEQGLDRRVEILLEADGDQLPFRLRQALRYLYSRRVGVHWPTLLYDLLYWNHPNGFVQKAWARCYFAPVQETESA